MLPESGCPCPWAQVVAAGPLSHSSEKDALGAKLLLTVSMVYAAAVLRLCMKENIPDPSFPPTLPPLVSDLKYLFTKLLQFWDSDKMADFGTH